MTAITAADRALLDTQKAQALAYLQDKITGTAYEGDDIDAAVDKVLAGMDFEGHEGFVDIVSVELQDLFQDGARQAVQQIKPQAQKRSASPIGPVGISLDLANERGVEYARDRAAELVGMKWVNGKLVPNPNADYQISDSTREMIRHIVRDVMEEGRSNDFLADTLAEIYAFSDERAETIARTETAKADVQGTLAGYREAGVARKQWLTAPDCCDLCQDLADVIVGIDESFPEGGGSGAPLHPNCRCDVLPVFDE